MPPPHGLAGFAAIKAGAEKAYRGLPWRFAAFGLPRRKAQTEQRGQTAANERQRTAARRRPLRRIGFCARRSFFRSEFKAPKNASIARFQGLGCYQSRSGFRPAARLLAFGFRFWLVAFSGSARVCVAGCLHGWMQAPESAHNGCGALGFAPFAHFLRANLRPQKCPHRTVSGAWLLSNQERIQACRAAFGIRLSMARVRLQALSSRAVKPKAGCAGKWQRANGCCGALNFEPVALFSGANSRPQKRPYRTVSGDLMLSKQERIQACCAALGIRHSAFGFGFGFWLVAFSGSAPVCVVGCLHGWRAGPRICSQRRRRFGFHAFRSFFESEFEAPKTALSHGLTGLAAIESIAKWRVMVWRGIGGKPVRGWVLNGFLNWMPAGRVWGMFKPWQAVCQRSGLFAA